jgi:hypothetical protein
VTFTDSTGLGVLIGALRRIRRASPKRLMGLEPHDLLHGNQWLNRGCPLFMQVLRSSDTRGSLPITVGLGNEWVTKSLGLHAERMPAFRVARRRTSPDPVPPRHHDERCERQHEPQQRSAAVAAGERVRLDMLGARRGGDRLDADRIAPAPRAARGWQGRA